MSRQGYSLGVKSVLTMIIPLKDAVSGAFATQTRKFTMPCTAKIVAIGLNVAARGGTHSTSTVDVKKTSTSLLAAVFDVAALTPGTIVSKESSSTLASAADSVAKDQVISIISTESGGTSPTWAGADLQIDYIPLGD